MPNHEQMSRPSAGTLHTPKQSRRRNGRAMAVAIAAFCDAIRGAGLEPPGLGAWG